MMPEFTLKKLNDMYDAGKRVDKHLFGEQRTNILLKMGEHYRKNSHKGLDELRQRGIISKEKKIRLTKNHIHRITNAYENSILEANPSAQAVPFNENEIQDVKSAEMHQAVMTWIKHTNKWQERQSRNVTDFVTIGEVFAKIRFDNNKGEKVTDEEGIIGYSGEFVIDRLFAFDMKRDPMARDADETKWWIHEQMLELEDFKEKVKELQPDKIDSVSADTKKTLKIFDHSTGEYKDTRKHVLVKELFMKPSDKYPNGWYAMYSDHILLVSEELPFGIYPIVYRGFDELTTSPRSASIIRVCRPYQVEINRAASKMAEHQITLGDDKVFIQKGTKISKGGYIHGVRAIQVSGKEPIIQSGRSGAQYLEYQTSQIKEMYEAADLLNVLQDDKQPVGDSFQLLFRAMKEKRRFVKYAEKYERFEIDVFSVALEMSKQYLESGNIIKIMGKDEQVNIPEFKDTGNEGFEIKLLAQSGDVETKFGKILSITQTLQYAGGSLNPDQIGGLIKQIPYGNDKQAFSSLTIDSDNLTNDILAMDRGEIVPVRHTDNHEFYIRGLTHRMKRSDFRFLDPSIQQQYDARVQTHEEVFSQQKLLIAQENLGMIPTGGFLTTVNASWPNPITNRVERLKVPSQALEWLVQKLQTQGQFAQEVQDLPPQSQADISAQTKDAPLLNQPQADINNNGPQA